MSLLRIIPTPTDPLTQTNVVYKFTCPFRECLMENNITPNTCIGYTTTTLFGRLTNHFCDVSTIKQYLRTKHNKDTDKVKSPDIRKILINNTKITLLKVTGDQPRHTKANPLTVCIFFLEMTKFFSELQVF